MKHQGKCGGTLVFSEDSDQSFYECQTCGISWTKRKRKPNAVYDTKPVTLTASEYEVLQQDSRRVKALRNIMDEYYIKRKIILSDPKITGAGMRLKRVTLNRISSVLSKDWDG